MKFPSLADWTGIVERKLFAQTYKSYGLATVRDSVLKVEARVEPFKHGRGFSSRDAGQPWCARRDLNPQHFDPKSNALSN